MTLTEFAAQATRVCRAEHPPSIRSTQKKMADLEAEILGDTGRDSHR